MLKDVLKSFPLLMISPIIVATGLFVLMLLSYVISFVFIHWILLIIFPILTIPIIFFILPTKKIKINIEVSVNRTFLKNITVLIIYMVPFAYFIVATNVMRWPPPGDIIAHGLLVSLLRHNGRRLFALEPLSQYSKHYPEGFHCFVANLAELTGLYSGEAVLITGALLSSLLPSLLFSLTYILTRSLILSLVPYLASFHIHSTRHLGRWVFGYFYNGPYPCFTGILCYVLLACLIVLFRKNGSTRTLYSIILVLTQLFATYPNFFITAAPIILFLIKKPLWQVIKKSKLLILACISLVIPSLFIVFYASTYHLKKYLVGKFSPSYKIVSIYFSDWSTWFMLLAIPMGIYLLFKSRDRHESLPAIFLITFLLSTISIYDEVYRFLCLILPSRLIIVSWVLSWVLISITLSTLSNRYLIKIKLSRRDLKIPIKLMFIMFMLVMFYPSLYQHFSLHVATGYAFYSRQTSFLYDYNVSVWISQNVPPNELILNDMSWSGFYLPSYMYKKVIFHYFPHPPEWNEARLIWLHVDNETLVRNVLRKLEIKWIFVTSEERYFDCRLYGGSQKYIEKPFKPAMYIKIFDSYIFLKKMYQYNNSAVYKVVLSP
ncbi:TPA: hypothetical protein EYP70_02655 [Candidatus Bathyarchaeota archaeon]|nr:hypothetical protein [Candidatus Bathyarchaeota archaeon]